jgi:hypothetical protein
VSFLLDTNVISEMTRKDPHPGVLGWLDKQAEETLFISVITLGELTRGILLLPTGKKRKALQAWLRSTIKEGFADRILPVDGPVIEMWAELQTKATKSGRPLPVMDSLIAATAAAHGLTIVSRNTADFQATEVRLFDPWRG